MYLVQITFVSTSFYLLDIPHYINKSIRRCCHKNKKAPFKDTWYFDIGFHQSYSSSMYLIVLLFSTVMPLANLFGLLFFLYKFYATKYNLIYVYLKEFDAKGKLRKSIIPTTIFTIIFSQLLNYAFLALTNPEPNNKFYVVGGSLVLA